jgi:hypothetical protein
MMGSPKTEKPRKKILFSLSSPFSANFGKWEIFPFAPIFIILILSALAEYAFTEKRTFDGEQRRDKIATVRPVS